MLKVSVVIPAHNEEANIEKMIRELLKNYSKHINEIIVVNDGSTDQTGKILKKLKKAFSKLVVVTRKPPNGVGLAIRDGIQHVKSTSTHILTMDADFIENVPDISRFIEKIQDFDGLVGSRYLNKNSLVRYPFFKRIANRTFHLLAKLILGIHQEDLTNNFKFYRKEIFSTIPLTASNFSINAETGIYPILLGYKIGEVPVRWIGRTASMGTSDFKLLKVGPDYLNILWKSIKYRINNTFLN